MGVYFADTGCAGCAECGRVGHFGILVGCFRGLFPLPPLKSLSENPIRQSLVREQNKSLGFRLDTSSCGGATLQAGLLWWAFAGAQGPLCSSGGLPGSLFYSLGPGRGDGAADSRIASDRALYRPRFVVDLAALRFLFGVHRR